MSEPSLTDLTMHRTRWLRCLPCCGSGGVATAGGLLGATSVYFQASIAVKPVAAVQHYTEPCCFCTCFCRSPVLLGLFLLLSLWNHLLHPLGHHGGISLQMSLPDGGASLFIPQGHSKDGAKTVNHTTLQTVNLWL